MTRSKNYSGRDEVSGAAVARLVVEEPFRGEEQKAG
jgi:hypothetical protein